MSIKLYSACLGPKISSFIKNEWRKAKQLVDYKDSQFGWEIIKKCCEVVQACTVHPQARYLHDSSHDMLSLLNARLFFKASTFLYRIHYHLDDIGYEEDYDYKTPGDQLRIKALLCCFKALKLIPEVSDAIPYENQLFDFLKIRQSETITKFAQTIVVYISYLPDKLKNKSIKAIDAALYRLGETNNLEVALKLYMTALHIYKNFYLSQGEPDHDWLIKCSSGLTVFKMNTRKSQGEEVNLETYAKEMRAFLEKTPYENHAEIDILRSYIDFSKPKIQDPEQYYTFAMELFQEIARPLTTDKDSNVEERVIAATRIISWNLYIESTDQKVNNRLCKFREDIMLCLLKERIDYFATATPNERSVLKLLFQCAFGAEYDVKESIRLKLKYDELKTKWDKELPAEECLMAEPYMNRPFAVRNLIYQSDLASNSEAVKK